MYRERQGAARAWWRGAVVMMVAAALLMGCGAADEEDQGMPYDTDVLTNPADFTDGVTPVPADFFNSALVCFTSLQQATARGVGEMVCVAEEDGSVEPGGSLETVALEAFDASDEFALETTSRELLFVWMDATTGAPRLRRFDRTTLVVEENITGFGGDFTGSARLATEGSLALVAESGTLHAFVAADLADGVQYTLNVGDTTDRLYDVATNGARVFTAVEVGSFATDEWSAWPRAGGAASWSVSKWVTGLVDLHAVAADARHAYLVTDEDATGAKLRVRAVTEDAGATVWTAAPAYDFGTMVPRAVSNGEILVVALNQRIVAYEAATGTELWTKTFANAASRARVTFGPRGQVFLARQGSASSNGVWAYDAATGRTLWTRADIVGVLDLVCDGPSLFVVFTTAGTTYLSRLAADLGPQVMLRVEETSKARTPWPRLMIPVR